MPTHEYQQWIKGFDLFEEKIKELIDDYQNYTILKNDEEFDGIFDHGKKMGNGYC